MPQAGAASTSPPEEAKTENFFSNCLDPQCGQVVPFHSAERTNSSLSRPQLLHANS